MWIAIAEKIGAALHWLTGWIVHPGKGCYHFEQFDEKSNEKEK